jgi:hypothetical protein
MFHQQGPTGLGKYLCVHQVERSSSVVKLRFWDLRAHG